MKRDPYNNANKWELWKQNNKIIPRINPLKNAITDAISTPNAIEEINTTIMNNQYIPVQNVPSVVVFARPSKSDKLVAFIF